MERKTLLELINFLYHPGLLHDDYIFDENKTVKENREEVKRANEAKESQWSLLWEDDVIFEDIRMYIGERCEGITKRGLQTMIDVCFDWFSDDFPIPTGYCAEQILDFIDLIIKVYNTK